jgi:hypothetical protein
VNSKSTIASALGENQLEGNRLIDRLAVAAHSSRRLGRAEELNMFGRAVPEQNKTSNYFALDVCEGGVLGFQAFEARLR